jgi:hypothetical protein
MRGSHRGSGWFTEIHHYNVLPIARSYGRVTNRQGHAENLPNFDRAGKAFGPREKLLRLGRSRAMAFERLLLTFEIALPPRTRRVGSR